MFRGGERERDRHTDGYRERELQNHFKQIKESDRRISLYVYILLKNKQKTHLARLEVKRIHSYIIYI